MPTPNSTSLIATNPPKTQHNNKTRRNPNPHSPKPILVSSQNSLNLAAEALSQNSFITLDTEFISGKTYWPKLCLIQAASVNDAFIIDPLAKNLNFKPFLNVLQNPNVLKVLHAPSQDIHIFKKEFNVIPSPLFDTQIAAMVCGFGSSASYAALVGAFVPNVKLDKHLTLADWSRRPLPSNLLSYAADDVVHLRNVYSHLKQRLDELNRSSWIEQSLQKLSDPSLYDEWNDPLLSWKRFKKIPSSPQARSVLQAAAAWREHAAQLHNLPRQWILPDYALSQVVAHVPKTVAELRSIQNIREKFLRPPHDQILVDALKNAQKAASGLPKPPKTPDQKPVPQQTLEMLRTLLRILCDQHKVAPSLVASLDDLKALARGDDAPCLHGWRRNVFGAHALSLKEGSIALSIDPRTDSIITTKLPTPSPHPSLSPSSPFPLLPSSPLSSPPSLSPSPPAYS